MSTQNQLLAKRLLEHSSEESRKQQLVITQNLAKQEQTLEERIERKRANSNRNPRAKLTSASFTCPANKDKDDPFAFVEVPPPPRRGA